MDLWYELAIRDLVDCDGVGLNQRAVELRQDAEEVLPVPPADEADEADE